MFLTPIVGKIREIGLRWFGHVTLRLSSAFNIYKGNLTGSLNVRVNPRVNMISVLNSAAGACLGNALWIRFA